MKLFSYVVAIAVIMPVLDGYVVNKLLCNYRNYAVKLIRLNNKILKSSQSLLLETDKDLPYVTTSDTVKKQLDKDFVFISVPAFIGLAMEPLVSFIDAMYVGQLKGAFEQAGMGIAISAQYSVAKLYNDPLLKTSTSLVAGKEGEDLSISVSMAIISAVAIGTIQSIVFLLFADNIISIMGVSKLSDMRIPAVSYLRWRALGVPAGTVMIVSNGIFRGRGDTRTPLYCTMLGNLVNIILDPIFIFKMQMNCAGVGAAIALSQWITAVPLVYLLHKSIPFNIFTVNKEKLQQSFSSYFSASGLILLRTIAKISAYTVTSSAAARLGTIPMAAYSLTFNLGFTAAQLCESVSVAAQSLLAKNAPFTNNMKKISARHIIIRAVQMGLFISLGLASTTIFNIDKLLLSLTSSPEVRQLARSVIPIVVIAQIIKGISSSTGGILLGGLDWLWSSISMQLASIVCIGLVFVLPSSLHNIWIALTAFMTTQVAIAAYRIISGRDPWNNIFAFSKNYQYNI